MSNSISLLDIFKDMYLDDKSYLFPFDQNTDNVKEDVKEEYINTANTINRTFYICNYCVDYKTLYKSDMKKHLTKKYKCKPFSEKYTFEKAYDISMCRTYNLKFNCDHLDKKDFAFIVHNYINIHNQVEEDFTNTSLIKANNENNTIECIKKEKNTKLEKSFVCPDCNKSFTSKQNLIKHADNKSLCEYNQKYNAIIEKANRKNSEQIVSNSYSHNQNIFNAIQTINNNIQNNQSNTHNTSNVHIKVNDFMNDRYDITHISDDFYKQKDFFLFNNFLEQIMLNKNNHNIYFIDDNTKAIIYTEDNLNKVSSEKVGYVILEKLEQALQQVLYKQDEDIKKYYDFINKYFRVLKGQYKHDTIYKVYDVNEQKFIYTSSSYLYRSRDKNLSKIISIINKHHSETKSNLSKYSDNQEIITVEPNIEDFMSRRCRYKDLKS